MKEKCTLIIAALGTAFLAGCCNQASPYDHTENWLLREDAVRPFSVPTDLIYVQGMLYTNLQSVAVMDEYVYDEVGKNRFAGIARIFAPLVANADDMENALEWYFDNQHGKRRPFLFIGEGECGVFLRQYEERNRKKLEEMGLLASFYSDDTHGGFVTDGTIKIIQEEITRLRYREQWGREMPEGMLGE